MALTFDCFARPISQGMIICFAKDNKQEIGVVTRIISSNSNIKVCFYQAMPNNPEKIIKINRVIPFDDQHRCVIVELIDFDGCITMFRQIKEHAAKLREGVMRGVKSNG